jgi:hypothetical protein
VPLRSYSYSNRPGRPGAGGSEGCLRPSAWSCDFSSAQITYSSGRSRRPWKRRWERSSTLPAFSAKAGSRTKIQERCCHGFRASSWRPAPDRRGGRLADPALDDEAVQLSTREAGKRQPLRLWQLAGERLHLGDLLQGENSAGGPRAADPRARPAAPRRTASANAPPPAAPSPAAARSRWCSDRRPRTEPSSPPPPPRAATCNRQRDAPTPRAPRRSTRSQTRSDRPKAPIRRHHAGPFTDHGPNLRTRVLGDAAAARPPRHERQREREREKDQRGAEQKRGERVHLGRDPELHLGRLRRSHTRPQTSRAGLRRSIAL